MASGSLGDVRVEGARHVVRHALLLPDAVAQPAADGVLPERVVHQPERVVVGIVAPDGRKPVRDVRLRLVHHRNDRHVAANRRSKREAARAAVESVRRHGPKTRAGHLLRAHGRDVADDDADELAGAKSPRVLSQQVCSAETRDDVGCALRRAAIGMPIGIEVGHQRFVGADRRVVVVLPNRRDHFPLADRQFVIRERGAHQDLAEQVQDRVEILGEAGASDREQVTRDGNRERDSAAVELFGNLRRRTRAPCLDRSRARAATSCPRRPADRRRTPHEPRG